MLRVLPLILMIGCAGVAVWIYLVASAQDEWVAFKLQRMAELGMLDKGGTNRALEEAGKTYRLTTDPGSSQGYVRLAGDYVLEGTPMPLVRNAAMSIGGMSAVASVASITSLARGRAPRDNG